MIIQMVDKPNTTLIGQDRETLTFKALLYLDVIYQTRETVFHRDIQTPRRELKIRRAAEYF